MYETWMMVLFMAAGLAVVAALCLILLLRWGAVWGSTAAEQAAAMPGDEFLDGRAKWQLKMTRAISIDAKPETVWPWIAQLGRGAGWFSVERLDNGGKDSARHLVSWVPEPWAMLRRSVTCAIMHRPLRWLGGWPARSG